MSMAVFLDRDGVINDVIMRDGHVTSPRSLDEFRLTAGVGDSLQRLAQAGFRLFVVTNQPEVARGQLDLRVLAHMHERIQQALPIDGVSVCPHDDADRCECRKPKPGMIRRIADEQGISLPCSYIIGDTWKDVEAGRGAGCRTILLRRDYNRGTEADHVVTSVAEAAQLVLTNMSNSDDADVGSYLTEVQAIASAVDRGAVRRLVDSLVALRSRGGRLFLLGVGGSAANASHAANDFRKICDVDAYCVTDNVSELTARINDDGWDSAYAAWLHASHISNQDAVLVFSVGGGDSARGVSRTLVHAIDAAKRVGATILGIVGRDGGYTAQKADVCVLVPVVNADRVTPHTEAYQAVIWHLLVSHPLLRARKMKWESLDARGAR
jgi:D-sedoheptulose 7-phosphate isomerase